MTSTWDVIAINFDTKTIRVIASDKSYKKAGDIEETASACKSSDGEFFCTVKSGTFKDGDIYD